MFKLLGIFILTIILFNSTVVLAQSETIEVGINWDLSSGACSECDFNAQTMEVDGQKAIKLKVRVGQNFKYSIEDIDYENTIYQSVYNTQAISNKQNFNVEFRRARGVYYAITTFKPFVNVNGVAKKLKSFKIQVTYDNFSLKADRAHVFASQSVLRKGDWYKIGIPKSGVYKLTKSILEELGVSVASLNPKHINIYANHNTELAISNNVSRADDLMKNAIFIQGESDNVFNDEDYVLFYATGPNREGHINGEGFNVSLNDYDSLNYVYLGIDNSESAKRVPSIPFLTASANQNINSFNEVVHYEKDLENILKSGRQWYGENYDIYLEQDFTINTPNFLSGSSAKMKTTAAVYAPSGGASLSFTSSGQLVSNLTGLSAAGSYTKAVFYNTTNSFNITGTSTVVSTKFNQGGNPSSKAWLDAIQINYKRRLTNELEQIRARSWESVGAGNISEFTINSTVGNTLVWDVTFPWDAKQIGTQNSGTSKKYKSLTDTLRTFAVFDQSQAYTPIPIGSIANQNLHAKQATDYLIVTHNKFTSQANRLADLHRAKGLVVDVVDIQAVYNEFSCGVADPMAIRWIAKMFYDRSNGSDAIQSLCLFGDGSYDLMRRISDNDLTNLIPTYQNSHSTSDNTVVSFINSYTSDDFFGLLDDDESISGYDLLDIGVGRIPVHTENEATAAVNKVEHYMNYGSTLYSNTAGVTCDANGFASSMGDWRTRSLLIADDEDNGKFVVDCESLSDTMFNKYPEMNVVKLYLDAFQQEATSSGQRYPDVENAINQIVNTGVLVANYIGHGGETGLSAERILSIPTIKTWTNIRNLTLFVSATCEFSRFDDPARVSAGEFMYLQPNGGAIALLTTTRLVFISTNSYLVRNLYSEIFKEENNQPLSLGEIIRRAKNLTAGDENMRNFTLLGDPALKLGKPQPKIITTHVNGQLIGSFTDTIKALSKVTVEGIVTDKNGNILSSFNGLANPTVYDKNIERETLGQDADSPIIRFDDRYSQLYKGKSTVKNGKFKFSFIVPKDIDYAFGKGKFSYYAENGTSQKLGYDTSVIIGGIDPNGINDNIGPDVALFMNDESFVDGGITDENPIFIAKVTDENGVNTTGNGIGHDISLILDGETSKPIILNNYYEADLDTYQSGQAEYQILALEPGLHTATFKVWDVNNNSSERTISFEVKPKEDVVIQQLLNYPNPFTTKTAFFFEHNQVCSQLETKIEIFTVSGKLVKTIFENVNTNGFRSDGIHWDGRDDFGDKIGRGVYIYRLSIASEDGTKAEKLEKLVIL